MNKAELTELLKPINKSLDDLEYDYDEFGTEATTTECCPECDCENEVMQNGKSDCSECGHKEILPCSVCPLNDLDGIYCDWNKDTRCSAFYKDSRQSAI